MIKWDDLKLPRGEAKQAYDSLKESGNIHEDLQSFIQPEFRELHDKLLQLWEESKNEVNSEEGKYLCDLHFALKLYELFEQEDFSLWEASDDEIWSGLTIKVAPDIYYDRWSWEDGDHEQRWIYKRTWRVWMKTLWWWIYLAMVTDESGKLNKEKTIEQLSIHETTSIEILLDRCGSGFRVDFCRKLMNKHYDYCRKNNISGTERRSSLKFVTMQCFLRASNIDPDLNGHDLFLDRIFEQMPGVRNNNENKTEGNGSQASFEEYLKIPGIQEKIQKSFVNGVEVKAPNQGKKKEIDERAIIDKVLKKHPFLSGKDGMVVFYEKFLEKLGSLDNIPENVIKTAFEFANSRLGKGNELDRKTFDLLFEDGLKSFKKQLEERKKQNEEEHKKKEAEKIVDDVFSDDREDEKK